ncbi:SRPBCC family protein [Pseudoxanthomonas sp. 10H]|uniref:SRPBCC family protein n=1 Tax=Pseudoxanthomonas sp. 10H TaxID=3242729 RepID=UPI003557C5F1
MNLAASPSAYATATAANAVRLERLLPGPVERVWSYLTDGDLRRQWLASGDMELEAGAPFELVWRNDELTDPPGHRPDGFGGEHRMQSRIIAVDPPHRLSFAWANGEVDFVLEPRGDQVLLTVSHRGISDHANLLMIGAGWHSHLDVLAARLRGSAPEPFWDQWSRLHREYAARLGAA